MICPDSASSGTSTCCETTRRSRVECAWPARRQHNTDKEALRRQTLPDASRLYLAKRCFTKGVGKVTLRDGHVLVDIEHTHVHLTILVRSHSTCRRASARAAVATGPAAACAAATCARAAVATCAAAACLRRIHREGQHWSTQRQVHRPVRPALSPQHARAASAYRHGRACSMLRGCTLS